MDGSSWPSEKELEHLRIMVAEMTGTVSNDVRVVVSPYRICPLGAHVDHQGGAVSAMTINMGILLAFVPSGNSQVILQSAQFNGEVRFSVDETQRPKRCGKTNDIIQANGSTNLEEDCSWGRYARGAVYALQSKGHNLTQDKKRATQSYILFDHKVFKQGCVLRIGKMPDVMETKNLTGDFTKYKGIIGIISGSTGLDSSGLSSSAAVGVAYLMAIENANNLSISATENVEYDRLIENEYLGLNNGIMDQSAILLSRHGCLTFMDCKTKEYRLIHPANVQKNHIDDVPKSYKILLAHSGLKQALTSNNGYNHRVAECREAAKVLLDASGNPEVAPLLSNVGQEVYEAYKDKLDLHLARRAEHYFSENTRVIKGLEAWASGRLDEFGKLITASGQSSIHNYECGCEPLIRLYEILVKAPGVYGARFSGAGFRGCCIAFVDADLAADATSFVKREYSKLQPELAGKINHEASIFVCDSGDGAHIVFSA